VDPDDVETYINLGFLEQNRGNLKQAAVYYQRAARLQPQGLADYFNQAVAFSALGLRARAVETFAMVIQHKPEFWQARYLLGVELAAQGKIEEARAQFVEAIRSRPDFAPSHLNLGVMLAKQEKRDQALTEFRIALQLDPTNPSAQQYIETIHASKGRGLESDSK
jgi:superkiller protein 3